MTDMVKIEGNVVRHTALADLYDLVAFLFQMPTAENIENLKQVSTADDVRAICAELGVDEGRFAPVAARLDGLQALLAADGNALSAVRIEHTRLFTKPHRPVIWPYEGVFVDDELIRAGEEPTEARVFVNPAASDAERAYRAAGFKVEGYVDPADYIVTELEFMARLHTGIAEASLADDAEREAELAGALETFRTKHAEAWIPRFFLRVSELGEHEFYLAAAALGTLLCQVEDLKDKAPAAK